MKTPTFTLLIFLFFGLLISEIYNPLFAQSQVSGKILNASGEPISFANILLLSAQDSSLVRGGVSEENGDFQFAEVVHDTYLLSVSMVGFANHTQLLEIAANQAVRIPQIVLEESDEELEEVTVTASKPLYERKIDRMVINVQTSITSAGNTVLEVLQKSPGVTVNRQSNSFTLNGKSGVMIMINDKLTRLPMEAVFQLLEGMSAANVEKIELITNPPSKYESEGTGGIIHIVTVDHEDIGTNGNWGLTAGRNARETLGANFNINHRKNKVSYFLDYSIHYDKNIEIWTNQIRVIQPDFVSELNSHTDRYSITTTQNFRTGGEYQISKKSAVGAMFTFALRNWGLDANTVSSNIVSQDSTALVTTIIRETNNWRHLTGNVHFRYEVNEKSKLRLDLDYLKIHNHNPSSYLNEFYFPETGQNRNERIDIRKETPLDIIVASMDYTLKPKDSFSLESGVKASQSNFINDVGVAFIENGAVRMDPTLTDVADLDETIYAAYLSADWNINETNQIKAGIRYEHTKTYISTLGEVGVVDRDFGNFFPTFYYNRKFNDHFNINLSYARRITRPTFWDLAPFVYILDPITYFSGNPALRPAILDGYRLDLSIKRAVLAFNYSNSKNEIANWQPEVDPISGRQMIRSQNLNFEKVYSVALTLPWIFTDWWDIQINNEGYYRELQTSHLEINNIRNIYNYNVNFINTIKFPKDYTLELLGYYESNTLYGILESRPFGGISAGLQKKMPNNGGTLRLSVDDVFYTFVWRMDSHIPESNLYSSFKFDYHAQAIRLNYTKSFGNKKLKEVNIKSGSEDERRRL
ncbi:TonB-dependent receptor [Litoribacter alkaliphilus]|uniref:TonB-dependent receptor n=1 Tax=Litoribacter ruber TaxID=702568 RepID=A0AAP2CNR9_9BACT|nr:outer membrane beta-barrel family protein [Litoribacter alkaliphilus]MBS9525117.1 TonB-dependent receptor [Litoribacter alkaliphilus]